MALKGYRSFEDKATRLLHTSVGFVVAIRKGPQRYEVRKDGVPLGEVHKFKNWFAHEFGTDSKHGASSEALATRKSAIEWLAAKATGSKP